MMANPFSKDNSEEETSRRKNRHTVNLNDNVFSQLGLYISKWGNTKENVVNQAVYDAVFARDQFLKAYAPHITLEHSTENAIFLQDSELDKIAVVRVRWNNLEKNQKKRSLISLYCETCDSDNCIHIRYSLVLPNTLRIRKEGKLV